MIAANNTINQAEQVFYRDSQVMITSETCTIEELEFPIKGAIYVYAQRPVFKRILCVAGFLFCSNTLAASNLKPISPFMIIGWSIIAALFGALFFNFKWSLRVKTIDADFYVLTAPGHRVQQIVRALNHAITARH